MNQECSHKWKDIDFKEIAQGNHANGNQDAFELFARDLFEAIGYTIEEPPSRGADGGVDLIISENKIGFMGKSIVKYIVSCKHYAHSNKSVGIDEEQDIVGRIEANGCHGFVGFYSTLPSTGLVGKIKNLKSNSRTNFEYHFFDREKIIDALHENEKTYAIYKRYLPNSFKANWMHEIDSQVYAIKPVIRCSLCNKNILTDMQGYVIRAYKESPGIIDNQIAYDHPIARYVAFRFSCQDCKNDLLQTLAASCKKNNYDLEAEEIEKFTNPRYYINELMTECSFLKKYPDRYNEDSYIQWNRFNRIMFYYVSRYTDSKNHPKSFARFDALEL